ncbi:MAG: hypothetical protein RBS40_08150 [Rhodocyclaceae bacterium]|nr:hypothetical protein [Rhodocyclaceae bacterium]
MNARCIGNLLNGGFWRDAGAFADGRHAFFGGANEHRNGIDARIHCGGGQGAVSRLQGLAAGPPSRLGQLLEGVGHQPSGLLAHLAPRLVRQAFADGAHHVGAALIGQPQGAAGLGSQPGNAGDG